MQAVATRSSRVAAKSGARQAVARSGLRVVCKANAQRDLAKKAALVASTLPATIAASPAFALVDDRLNGDGTGLVFGVNDATLGWVLAGVFGVMWAIWFNAQKDLGDFEDPEDGLKL